MMLVLLVFASIRNNYSRGLNQQTAHESIMSPELNESIEPFEKFHADTQNEGKID